VARLSGVAQRYIVRALAHWTRPTEILDGLRLELGVETTLSQLSHYNPQHASGRQLSKPLRAYFAEERSAAKAELEEIPLAHLPHRLRLAQRRMEGFDELGIDGYLRAQEIQDRAARDLGGMNTNSARIELGGEVKQKVLLLRSLDDLLDQ
jgi:hypothetical protein